MSMEEQKKRRARRKFTDEFKARAVRLVLKEGQTAAQVARDLDVGKHAREFRGVSRLGNRPLGAALRRPDQLERRLLR